MMNDKRIEDFATVSTLQDDDLFLVGGSGETFKTTFATIKNAVSSGGGGSDATADVTFYDYDGSVVAAYTKSAFAKLKAMPANPTHEGLTSQGWNWSFEDAKAYVAKYGRLSIGQMYDTSDGKTRIHIHISDDILSENQSSHKIEIMTSADNEITIDWGDGYTETFTLLSGNSITKSHKHIAGDYIIAISSANKISITGSSWAEFSNINQCITSMNIGSNIEDISVLGGKNTGTITLAYGVTSIGSRNRGVVCGGKTKHIAIPYSVTSICQYAFRDCRSLENVSLPNSISNIPEGLLMGAFSVRDIYVPDSVTVIGKYAFRTSYIRSGYSDYEIPSSQYGIIVIPDSVNSIGLYAFEDCGAKEIKYYANADIGVSSISIRKIYIGSEQSVSISMQYCRNLESVTCDNAHYTIGNYAFYDCCKLKDIDIPNDILSIGDYAFQNCLMLEKIELPEGITEIKNYTFYSCEKIYQINIPSTVLSIGSHAFYNCESISRIEIPIHCANIGDSAFDDCTYLQEVHIRPVTPPSIGTNVFRDFLGVIYVPYSSDHSILEAYKNDANWSAYASRMQEEPQ